MEIFRAENVVKKYATHTALNNVSINVPQGSIFGLLGPNGAGKTTLIRIINQITAPDSGSIFFRGNKMQCNDIEQIGYLPEERGLYKKMKIGEQALYLAQLKGMKKNEALKRLKYWFEKFEIEAWWGKKVEELSKGMQQKVQFIVTILHEPPLLIFDEPFSGFDPINANLLKQEILELKAKGSTIIFSTHNMSSVEELCDHIALINKSQVVLNGEFSEIKNTYKSNTFEITFSVPFIPINTAFSADYQIISVMENSNKTNTVQLKLLNNISTNELLRSLMNAGNIIEFKEVIPNMNDIFIEVIKKQEESLKNE